jgi:hypothetical protein
MPDEVIADLNRYGGGAQALPLFSCRHVFCCQLTFSLAVFILRDVSLRDAPQDEVSGPSW